MQEKTWLKVEPQAQDVVEQGEQSATVLFRPKLWSPPLDTGLDIASQVTTLQQRLSAISTRFKRIKLASSLAVEDMVLTDVLVKLGLEVEIFSLQTGMLHPETLDLIARSEAYWDISLKQYKPDEQHVQAYVSQHGKYAFYERVEMRRECCRIRKIEPLNAALSDADAWITGQRREQSVTRTAIDLEEFDQAHGIAKFNPLFDWTEAQVWAYVREHELPTNKLYELGYPSIGCDPCTKPVKAGDDVRSGRWWWENKDSKECGLHR